MQARCARARHIHHYTGPIQLRPLVADERLTTPPSSAHLPH